jgi:mannose-6-phosphate isomerase-like protein (cupin superfamily)|tara:strand:+ start:22025 stop:22441 length:417 start_codon:yes stop_codon:yes gene_type:complete
MQSVNKIYSKQQEGKLLHIILRKEDVCSERMNVIEDEQFLQLAAMRLPAGKTFKPHKHIHCEKHTLIAQESWVVISGKVKAILYDLDDTIISEVVLNAGDCSITLYGGHTYEILEDGTLVYEYKTGPYLGIEMDKEFI